MLARRWNMIFRITAAAVVLLLGCAGTRQWKIRGCVVDRDGTPIAGAKIKVKWQNQHTKARSGQDGRFSVGIDDRNHPSFLSVSVPGYAEFIPLDLTPGSYCRYFQLYLYSTPQPQNSYGSGNLYGEISDESGEVVPGSTIGIEGTPFKAISFIDGSYRILNIPAGLYGITARVVGYYPVYCYPVYMKQHLTTILNVKFLSLDMDCGTISGFGSSAPFDKYKISNERKLTEDQTSHDPAVEVNNLVKACPGLDR
jgi:hypothetical protein